MRSLRRSRVLVLLLVPAASCAQIIGADFSDRELEPSGEASGGNGGGAGAEDCGDGADDGGDGLPDCADDDCGGGTSCVSLPQSGWSGPAWLVSAPGSEPPACPDGLENEGPALHDAFSAPAPGCDCACQGSAGCSWSFVTIAYECGTGNTCSHYKIQEDQCLSIAACSSPAPETLIGYEGLQAQMPSKSPTCTPIQDAIPPAQWGQSHSLCSAGKSGGCGTGEVCIGKAPTGTLACIYRDGDVPCPPGAYTQKLVYHQSFTDTRGCSELCQCTPPVACSSKYQLWTNGACEGQDTGNTYDFTGCYQPPPAGAISIRYPAQPCEKTLGTPSGEAVPANPTTLCCAPTVP